MATPIAIAVVEDEGRFLIGQRPDDAPLAGYWEFPGGKIELGECAEDAAVRECLEETGLTVRALDRYPPQVEPYDHGNLELHFIACQPVSGDLSQPSRFRWVQRQDLASYRFPSGNRLLLRILASR